MNTFDKKESPLRAEQTGAGVTKQYFTAEEAMSFMEPRIRAMFK